MLRAAKSIQASAGEALILLSDLERRVIGTEGGGAPCKGAETKRSGKFITMASMHDVARQDSVSPLVQGLVRKVLPRPTVATRQTAADFWDNPRRPQNIALRTPAQLELLKPHALPVFNLRHSNAWLYSGVVAGALLGTLTGAGPFVGMFAGASIGGAVQAYPQIKSIFAAQPPMPNVAEIQRFLNEQLAVAAASIPSDEPAGRSAIKLVAAGAQLHCLSREKAAAVEKIITFDEDVNSALQEALRESDWQTVDEILAHMQAHDIGVIGSDGTPLTYTTLSPIIGEAKADEYFQWRGF